MPREWLFSTLSSISALVTLVGDRIWLGTSVEEIPATKPFIVFRFGLANAPLRGSDVSRAVNQPLQIFYHDDVGDYARVDQMLKLGRQALDGVDSAEHGVIRCEWLEDSEDLRDDEWHTNTRFSRYELKIQP